MSIGSRTVWITRACGSAMRISPTKRKFAGILSVMQIGWPPCHPPSASSSSDDLPKPLEVGTRNSGEIGFGERGNAVRVDSSAFSKGERRVAESLNLPGGEN